MKKIFCALSTLIAVFGVAHADVLADFNFTGDSSASSDSSIFSSVSAFNVGVGSISDGLVSATAASVTQNPDVDPAGSDSQFQSFTLTVTGLGAGETLDLTSLTYTYTAIQPLNFAVGLYSSVDGFGSTAAQLDGVDTDTNYASPQTFNQTVALSGVGFKGLENSDTIEFRFYLADASSSTGRHHQLDNIVLNGSANGIPEPSMLGLVGFVGLAALSIRGSKGRIRF